MRQNAVLIDPGLELPRKSGLIHNSEPLTGLLTGFWLFGWNFDVSQTEAEGVVQLSFPQNEDRGLCKLETHSQPE